MFLSFFIAEKPETSELKLAETEFGRLSAIVNKQLNRSAYSEIKMGELFSELIPKKFTFAKNKSKPENNAIATTSQ